MNQYLGIDFSFKTNYLYLSFQFVWFLFYLKKYN